MKEIIFEEANDRCLCYSLLISILSIHLRQRSHLFTLSFDILIIRTVPSSFDLRSLFTQYVFCVNCCSPRTLCYFLELFV